PPRPVLELVEGENSLYTGYARPGAARKASGHAIRRESPWSVDTSSTSAWCCVREHRDGGTRHRGQTSHRRRLNQRAEGKRGGRFSRIAVAPSRTSPSMKVSISNAID